MLWPTIGNAHHRFGSGTRAPEERSAPGSRHTNSSLHDFFSLILGDLQRITPLRLRAREFEGGQASEPLPIRVNFSARLSTLRPESVLLGETHKRRRPTLEPKH